MAHATVNLNVDGAQPPDNTWKRCKDNAGNDTGFWYKFAGGNSTSDDGSWSFDHDASGHSEKQVDVQLVCADGWDPDHPDTSQGYRITGISISYHGSVSNDKKDISIKKNNDPRCWTLKNKNKHQESGEFSVIVSYTPPGTDPSVVTGLHCDPGWQNK